MEMGMVLKKTEAEDFELSLHFNPFPHIRKVCFCINHYFEVMQINLREIENVIIKRAHLYKFTIFFRYKTFLSQKL